MKMVGVVGFFADPKTHASRKQRGQRGYQDSDLHKRTILAKDGEGEEFNFYLLSLG